MAEAIAYKILTAAQMATLNEGIFLGAPVDLQDGYIHLSARDQVAGTLEKHFHGQDDLWIAEVPLDRLGDAVKWEVSRGGAKFPHLYAPLHRADVSAAYPVAYSENGSLKLQSEA